MIQCPECGGTKTRPVATDTAERNWRQCETCGAEFDESEALLEQKIHELFEKRFPPGSDGPPEGFNLIDLYLEVKDTTHDERETSHADKGSA